LWITQQDRYRNCYKDAAIAVTLSRKTYTADDLFDLPSDLRVELIRGELVPKAPPPGGEHGEVTISLSSFATVHVLQNDLGRCFAAETGFKIEFDPDTVRGPDWAFVSNGRLPHPMPQRHVPLAPDVVLETVSPDDRPRKVRDKVQMWLDAGVKVVWLLDPRPQTLTIFRPDAQPVTVGPADTLTCPDLLPGFDFQLSRLFR
jgi:Uma2 family endonuclease